MFDDYYGLTGRPFQLTPDPEFYFESATHRKALSYLGYGMAQGEGFIVITGEVGAGKSTLVAHLMQRIDPAQMTVGQIVTSALDGEEMVHVVAQSFGLDIDGHDKAAALGAIEEFLHGEARAGRRCLLVVDESQNLEVGALEELRMLSNFQLGSHPLLQTLLLGQPEFKATLAYHEELEQLRQRVIAAHHLEAMGQGEIEPYVRHRLQLVGWDENPAIDQRVFTEMYTATGGVPRKVNQVMTRLLLLGAVEERSRIDNAMLTAVLSEMKQDAAFPEAAPAPMKKVERAATAPAPINHDTYHTPERRRKMDEEFAERDAQIAELQQAIVELAEERSNDPIVPPDLLERITALEVSHTEQERSIRHVLTLLIEWFEEDNTRRAA